MSSSLLLQQCPACLVHLTWIVFVMGGRWPYSCCFVGCCLQICRYLNYSNFSIALNNIEVPKPIQDLKLASKEIFWMISELKTGVQS